VEEDDRLVKPFCRDDNKRWICIQYGVDLPKGKGKLISQKTDKISQQQEYWENRNGPDLVQAFPRKW
jgi:hypothetical protein